MTVAAKGAFQKVGQLELSYNCCFIALDVVT